MMEFDANDGGSPSPPPLDEALSDDVLSHTLSYLDFPTAVQFASCVSVDLRRRILPPPPQTHTYTDRCGGTASGSRNGTDKYGGRDDDGGDTGDDDGDDAINSTGGVIAASAADYTPPATVAPLLPTHPPSPAFVRLWSDIYHRHNFCPPGSASSSSSSAATASVTATATATGGEGAFDAPNDNEHDATTNGGTRDVESKLTLTTTTPTPAPPPHHGINYLSLTKERRDLFDNLTGESAYRRKLNKTNEANKKTSNLAATATEEKSDGSCITYVGRSGSRVRHLRLELERRQRKQQRLKQCLSIPNRYVNFVPLTPGISSVPLGDDGNIPDDADLDNDDDASNGAPDDFLDLDLDLDDPPPVEFDTDSFALLPGTSPSLVLMDPFDGTIVVRDDLLEGAVRDDDDDWDGWGDMLLECWRGGVGVGSGGREGEVVRRRNQPLRRNSSNGDNRRFSSAAPPSSSSQILFGVEDYFATDLAEYFIPPRDEGNRGGAPALHDGDEVTVDWLGIDLHTILSSSSNSNDCSNSPHRVEGHLVGAARILTVERSADDDDDSVAAAAAAAAAAGRPRSCTEILGWKARTTDSTAAAPNDSTPNSTGGGGRMMRYDEKYACRMTGCPSYVDIDPVNDRIYATFPRGDGPQQLSSDVQEEGGEDEEDGTGSLSDVNWDGTDRSSRSSSTVVFRYPFVPLLWRESKQPDEREQTGSGGQREQQRLFPNPEACVVCTQPVSCLSVDPTGDALVVGTYGGRVEIWSACGLQQESTSSGRDRMRRVQILDLPREIRLARERIIRHRAASLRRRGMVQGEEVLRDDEDERMKDGSCCVPPAESRDDGEIMMDTARDDDDVPPNMDVDDNDAVEDINDGSSNTALPFPSTSPAVMQCDPTRKVDSIHLPRHLPIDRCGFVTLHHHQPEGTTLCLWQKPSMTHGGEWDSRGKGVGDGPSFGLSAVINLPLSSRRKPQVHYDGRRLIVFGQDHVGLIVLVYHVLSSWEDRVWFVQQQQQHEDQQAGTSNGHDGCDDSGGIVNLPLPSPTAASPSSSSLPPARIRYANRIRHAGLGGLEYHDPVLMTCNERFVVLNTKTGNLVGGGGGGRYPGACEGLFVIDLEERS